MAVVPVVMEILVLDFLVDLVVVDDSQVLVELPQDILDQINRDILEVREGIHLILVQDLTVCYRVVEVVVLEPQVEMLLGHGDRLLAVSVEMGCLHQSLDLQ